MVHPQGLCPSVPRSLQRQSSNFRLSQEAISKTPDNSRLVLKRTRTNLDPLQRRLSWTSAYSPPSFHYPGPLRPAYAVHSRADSNASSTDYRSRQTHDDAFSDPSNHSPRPSTGSTGVADSTVQVHSLSPHSSVSPDISTQALSNDQNRGGTTRSNVSTIVLGPIAQSPTGP